ncbi:MAG TPA: hypothetical protein DCS93_29685 [Microscillaceae bacterium]|nr:hypothetical protein [Microscillaceae bacterium]
MKKLSVLAFLVCLTFATTLQAQTKIELMHEAGISNLFLRYEFGINTGGVSTVEVTDAEAFYGINYSPRLNFFDESGDGSSSFSINLNNDLLFGNLISRTLEKQSLAFATNLSFNLNLGAGATRNTLNQFGGFMGIGYTYSNINLININQFNRVIEDIVTDPTATPDFSKAITPLQGIYFHLGGRMKLGSGVITLEGYTTLSPELNGVYTIGIRAQYGLGIAF